jgi:hypothetical protein
MYGVQLKTEFQRHASRNRPTRAADDFFQLSDMLHFKGTATPGNLILIFFATLFTRFPPLCGFLHCKSSLLNCWILTNERDGCCAQRINPGCVTVMI